MNRLTWILGVVLALALIFGVTQCQKAQYSSRRVAVSESQAGAVSQSATDAIGAVGAVAGRNTASDDLTRENADAIHNAAGADAPVHSDVRDAGLAGLCRRAAYRGSEQCMQFTVASGVVSAGAGGAAPER